MTSPLYPHRCDRCNELIAYEYPRPGAVVFCPPCHRVATEAYDPQPGDEVALLDGAPRRGRLIVVTRDGDDFTVTIRRPGYPDSPPWPTYMRMLDPTTWKRNGFNMCSWNGRRS